jgi:hypothetical protein
MFSVHCKIRLAGFLASKLWEYLNYNQPRESLASDIPAGDGKTAYPFFTVYTHPVLPFLVDSADGRGRDVVGEGSAAAAHNRAGTRVSAAHLAA